MPRQAWEHEWTMERAEEWGADPYAGCPPEKRAELLALRTRRAIDRKIDRITRSEPTALYLGDILTRRLTVADLLRPGETLEPLFDGCVNAWPEEYLTLGQRRRK